MRASRLLKFSLCLVLCLAFSFLGYMPGIWAAKKHDNGTSTGVGAGDIIEWQKLAKIPKDFYRNKSKACVEKGLRYLKSVQQRDGSIGGESGKVASTALAGLCFLSNGSSARSGEYRPEILKCLDYVCKCQTEEGVIRDGTARWSDSHAHGYSMLFLSQVYGTYGDGLGHRIHGREKRISQERLGEILRKAIKASLKSQSPNGGWGYGILNPNLNGFEDEASTSICQIQGLRAAYNAGFTVPKESIDHAIKYVRDSFLPKGGFYYSLSKKMVNVGAGIPVDEASFAISSAGLSVLNFSGIYEKDKIIDTTLKHVKSFMPGRGREPKCFYFYGHFYAAQAMYFAGESYWLPWYQAICKDFPNRQRENGSFESPTKTWEDSPGYGAPYVPTCFAILALQIPTFMLPIENK